MKLRRQLALVLAAVAPVVTIDATVAEAHTPSTADSAGATGTTYTVRAGDGLASIARKVGVRLADLLAANQLTISSTIHPGQLLVVPAGGIAPTPSQPNTAAQAPSTAGMSRYTVKAGDSLFAIARRNGVTLNALLSANSFTITSTILPGQVIGIPTSSTPMSAPERTPTTVTPAMSTPIETLLAYLREQVGKPYKFFTAGPDTFDCSGLVVAGYRQIGITLPHQSRMQSSIGTAVDWRNQPIQAGDLIFMVSSVDPTRIGHVGVALDADTWIQAVAPGIPVRVRPIPGADKISAVRRIVTA